MSELTLVKSPTPQFKSKNGRKVKPQPELCKHYGTQ